MPLLCLPKEFPGAADTASPLPGLFRRRVELHHRGWVQLVPQRRSVRCAVKVHLPARRAQVLGLFRLAGERAIDRGGGALSSYPLAWSFSSRRLDRVEEGVRS